MENRNFQGVWIPKEIYLSQELNWTEKILLIEITSLDNEEHCIASNKYFADFLGVNEFTISHAISKLKKLGYIKQIDFDGRQRRLASCLNAGLLISTNEGCEKQQGSIAENSKAQIYNNIENNIGNNLDYIKENFIKEKTEPFENEFQDFWELFPRDRRGNKQKAYKAYLRVLKQKRATVTQLLLSVSQYAKSEEVKRGFAKGCEAWLNDDRFNVNYTLKAQGKKTASDITDDSIREFLRRNSNNEQEGEREYEGEFENIYNVD